MTSAAIPTEPSLRRARRLQDAAFGLLVALPLLMTLANRSAPLTVTVAALAALGAAWHLAGWRRLVAALRSISVGQRTDPSGLPRMVWIAGGLALLALWLLPRVNLPALGEAVISVAAGAAIVVLLPQRRPRWLGPALAAALVVACLWIVAELASGMMLRHALGLRPHSYIFNRSVLVAGLLLWPAMALLAGRPSHPAWRAAAAALLATLVAGTALRSESGAAALGLLAGALAYGLAWLAPRFTAALVGLGLLAALAVAPVIGDLAHRALPPSLHEGLRESHSRARVAIWQSFGAAVQAATPVEMALGQGFGTSADLASQPVAARVPEDRRVLLGAGHPHNAYLQIWVELGLIGVGIAGLAFVALARSLARLPVAAAAPRLGLIAMAGAVALVGHGAWQGWWLATLGAAWALLPAPSARPKSGDAG